MPDGRWVADDEGHYAASRFCMRGDQRAIEGLANLVRSCGVERGRPKFLENRRPVTDEEYEEQRQRMLFGLHPDPMDITGGLDRA